MQASQMRRNDETDSKLRPQQDIEMTGGAMTRAAATAEERRVAEREASRDLCEILVERSRIAIPCLARNISQTGALLETNATDLPNRFILANHTRHIRSVCQIAWRHGRLIGVRFATAPRSFE